MNCYNHITEPSVAQCQDCKKGLCIKCTQKFSFPICSNCNTKRKNDEKKQIYLELFFSFGLGILLTYFMVLKQNANFSFSLYLTMFYGYSGIVPGWKLLNKIFPRFYFSFSMVYFAILLFKFMTAIFVGFIALPIITFINIHRLIKLNKTI
jgi:hypothetical protein